MLLDTALMKNKPTLLNASGKQPIRNDSSWKGSCCLPIFSSVRNTKLETS